MYHLIDSPVVVGNNLVYCGDRQATTYDTQVIINSFLIDNLLLHITLIQQW